MFETGSVAEAGAHPLAILTGQCVGLQGSVCLWPLRAGLRFQLYLAVGSRLTLRPSGLHRKHLASVLTLASGRARNTLARELFPSVAMHFWLNSPGCAATLPVPFLNYPQDSLSSFPLNLPSSSGYTPPLPVSSQPTHPLPKPKLLGMHLGPAQWG